MRILYLSQLIPFPPDAGPKVRIYHVLQHLAQAGHSVTFVAFRRANDRPDYLEEVGQYCDELVTVPMKRSRLRDVWHLGRSLLTGQPFLIARDSVAEMHRVIDELMTQHRFDAVHADQLWMAQYALGARARLNGRSDSRRDRSPLPQFVLDQHNAVFLIPQRLAESYNNQLLSLFLRREAAVMQRYELDVCRQFDEVVWVTDEDWAALSAAANGHRPALGGRTIPICVDPQAKSIVPRQQGGQRVTFLGGLHWPPNAEGVMWFVREVWPQIIAQAPTARLTIIGKDPPAELPADSPNVDVTGYVADPTPYLAETAAFIVPLHAGGGMRVKIIDAWAWGLPVVSTSIGAEGLDYEHGRNLLVGDTAEAFAEATIRLLQQPSLATHLITGGRQTVEASYDWRKTYKLWQQIYPAP